MDTIVVYIENENKKHFNLIHSLGLLNIESHRLFENGEWKSYFDKINIYIDGLSKITNEWVILSDSRDVLFYKDMETINKVYQTYYSDSDIIIQAEDTHTGCIFMEASKMKRYEFNDTIYKYPCSGLMMGKRTVLIDFFKDLISKTPKEWRIADQPAVEWGMANLDYKIKLDSKCRLFQPMGMGNYSGVNFNLHFNKNFIKNTLTNTEPCIFHGAGGAFLHPVWKIINKKY